MVRFQISFDWLLSYKPIYYLDYRYPDLSKWLFGGPNPTVRFRKRVYDKKTFKLPLTPNYWFCLEFSFPEFFISFWQELPEYGLNEYWKLWYSISLTSHFLSTSVFHKFCPKKMHFLVLLVFSGTGFFPGNCAIVLV